jgi:RNA polymerase sigma-70 factor (ECF subfamily)
MVGGGQQAQYRRTVVYCVVPSDLAARLHEPLRRHFAGDAHVEVIVERRAAERRQAGERRATSSDSPPRRDRRHVEDPSGRRVADRRAALVVSESPPLPRKARPYADRLRFIERLALASDRAEDIDTRRLVARFQGGDRDVFAALYMRYFDRVYNYLRLILNDRLAAEDATQQVFVNALEGLPDYEQRRQPFRAWLFVIARNHALNWLAKEQRSQPMDGRELERRRDQCQSADIDLGALEWVSDPELLLFIERLPVVQRQVLLLRFMLDLPYDRIAEILGRNPDDVRALQSRAVRFLRARLTALGHGAEDGERVRMRRRPQRTNVLRARRWALLS